MSSRKLRAAVIGGGLGGHHGYAYTRAEEYELIAACDINPAAFDRFFERAQIERGSIREYTDYKEMFAQENLDVVGVATSDHLHAFSSMRCGRGRYQRYLLRKATLHPAGRRRPYD